MVQSEGSFGDFSGPVGFSLDSQFNIVGKEIGEFRKNAQRH